MPSIRLSEKHGVNPSVGVCFYCYEDDGTVVLPGLMRGDVEAPHRAVWTMEPCEKCKKLMQMGVMLVSVRDGEKGENPYRTGRLAVLKDEAIQRIVANEALMVHLLKRRFGFVEDSVWKELGLPM